jgi:hypothetical protein
MSLTMLIIEPIQLKIMVLNDMFADFAPFSADQNVRFTGCIASSSKLCEHFKDSSKRLSI